MKKIILNVLIPAAMVLFSGICFAQTADEIIANHIEAHGGLENWEAIKSMKITGQFTSFSEIHPFTDIKARGGKYLSKHNRGQFPATEGCNGKIYWVDDPWFELGFPHIANSIEAYVIKQKAEFCTPFFNYKEKGFTVAFEGEEKVEGKDVYKMVLTRDDGNQETWFLNTETYLEVMSTSLWADFASPSMQEVFYDDFRKVGNIIIPFYTERVFSIRNRIVEIENVELNIDPDPSIFCFPLSPEMQKLKFMAGDWNVVLESRGRSGNLQFADSTFSEIVFVKNKNLIQENISYTSFFPIQRVVNWSYSSDFNTYMMTLFNSFYSNTSVFMGDFSSDTLMVDNSQIKYKDETENGLSKYSILKIDDDTMIVEMYQSRDGGENWAIAQRFTYTRKKE